MTEYQTTIQKPGAIRFGSAKIEIENDDNEWVDLGALKSVSSKVNVSEGTSYEPDNAPKQEMDATVESWDWTATPYSGIVPSLFPPFISSGNPVFL